MKAQLSALLLESGLILDEAAIGRVLRYQALLAEANATQNLTALRSPDVFLREGILDSLLAWRTLGVAPQDILDVGSGGGLPAIVWLAAGYAPRATLVEAEKRKVEFLRSVVEQMGLDVGVCWARAEDEARGTMRDGVSLVTARAVASAPVAVEVCGGLVRPGGLLCLLKGEPGRAAEEAVAAAAVAARMGFGGVDRRSYRLAEGIERTLLIYRKERPTPAGRPISFARLKREFPSQRPSAEREGAGEGE